MKKLYYFLLATSLFFNLQCDKDPEPQIAQDLCEIYGKEDQRCREQELAKLPPYTETGEGTFGCLVNGEAFIPSTCCGNILTPPPPIFYSTYYTESKTYYIDAINRISSDKPYYNIGVNLLLDLKSNLPQTIIIQEGIYKEKSGGGVSYKSDSQTIKYSTFNPSSGEFIINHIDTLNQVISGTFDFKAATETDTIYITDGRFDMPYALQ